MSFYRAIVSAFIGISLVFQAIIALGPIGGLNIGTKFWPFVNYAMYSRSFKEGDFVDYYRLLEGITRSGERIEIPMESLGLHLWHYRDLVRDLERQRPEALDLVLASLPPGIELVEIEVKSFPVAVTRSGPVEQGSIVLDRIPVPAKESSE